MFFLPTNIKYVVSGEMYLLGFDENGILEKTEGGINELEGNTESG